MEGLEILFILLFIFFGIMEQVLKKRQGPGPEEPEPGPEPMDTAPGEVSAPSSERKPVKAAEMVPDDLWAILTGEQRPTEGVEWADQDEEPVEEEPWSVAPWEDEPEPPPMAHREEKAPAPVSLEYRGPEAYSLEPVDFEAESLEAPVPSSEARHRRFHEIVDRPPPRARARRSAVGRALRTPAGLRGAFVLSEVLGPPKGLDP